LLKHLSELKALSGSEIRDQRYEKFRRMGIFEGR
jgi:acetyl-CoA carboxylase alpha subunit